MFKSYNKKNGKTDESLRRKAIGPVKWQPVASQIGHDVYPSFERPSSEQQVSICRVCLDKSTPFSFHGVTQKRNARCRKPARARTSAGATSGCSSSSERERFQNDISVLQINPGKARHEQCLCRAFSLPGFMVYCFARNTTNRRSQRGGLPHHQGHSHRRI